MIQYLSENFLGLFFLIISAFFDTMMAGLIKTVFNRLGRVDLTSPKLIWAYSMNMLKDPLIWLAAIVFALGPVFMLLGFNRLKITEGYPIVVASHMFFIGVAGYFFLNEYLNVRQVGGWVLIIMGLVVFYSASVTTR